jgi:hypothetical protein
MELLVVVGLLAVVALASLRWGVDSRPRPDSREAAQAALGLTWGARRPRSWRVDGRSEPALRIAQRVRRREAIARRREPELDEVA